VARLVMVVDDDRDIREAISDSLECAGFDVVQARDGAEAFDLARALPPSLIILDLMMPRMNGWEFRTRQASDPQLRGVPVIVISAMANMLDAPMPASFLAKPFDLDRLLHTVDRLAA